MNLSELVAAYGGVAIASIADSVDKIAGRRGYLDHDIRPRINEQRVVGPAVTVLEGPEAGAGPPQHALELIDSAGAGSVMVIAIDGQRDVAIWGGLMTAGAFARGFAGAILDGGVRDVSEIRRDYGFPVYARSISPGSTVGRFKTLGANIPVTIGGVDIRPGDIMVADPDGVVCVPRVHAETVLAMAREIDSREAEQAKLIVQSRSLKEGLMKYGRI
jgi:4-hydroxy-4-methyl-2-oxoglutarate aldolase